MADNVAITAGAGTTIAADEATYSGDTAKIQLMRLVHVSGAEGAKTVSELVRAEDAAHTSGDPGIPLLAVRTDTTAARSGADGDYEPLQVKNGRLAATTVLEAGTAAIGTLTKAGAATVASVLDTATSTTVLASNANRLAAIIVNDSAVDLYLKYGATASVTSYTYKLGPGETLREELYTGVIDGIWASDGAGAARVTELTAS